jgi:hypothetical protein
MSYGAPFHPTRVSEGTPNPLHRCLICTDLSLLRTYQFGRLIFFESFLLSYYSWIISEWGPRSQDDFTITPMLFKTRNGRRGGAC